MRDVYDVDIISKTSTFSPFHYEAKFAISNRNGFRISASVKYQTISAFDNVGSSYSCKTASPIALSQRRSTVASRKPPRYHLRNWSLRIVRRIMGVFRSAGTKRSEVPPRLYRQMKTNLKCSANVFYLQTFS